MSEAHIQQLGRMGFGRAQAEAALAQAGNDIYVAIDLALNGSAEAQAAARPFTPPTVGLMEPEPEPGPQEQRAIQRSQQFVASGDGSGMIDRLRARRDHQESTLEMLRKAGASEEELKVIRADVEVLQRQVAEYEENQAAIAAAREAAREAQEQAQRQREEQQARQEEARLAREAAAAEAAEQIRLAKDAAARAKAEEASQAATAAAEAAAAAAAAADLKRQQEVDAALHQQVQAELRAQEAGVAAVQGAVDALTESTVRTEWRVEVLDATTKKEGEDGWIFSASSYTTYDIQVTRPDGTATVITKRYSDFDELKTKLAVTEEAKQAEIANLDFANWTWTRGGSMHEDTIADRKTKLGSWLNAVLFLCPDSKDVVEFIDGEAGLLASVNDENGPQ